LSSECALSVVKHIAVLFQTGTATGLSDGALLDRFRNGSAEDAESAFAALVERHGPTVFHVCRRILGDRHDAEDASQAVFLVLARQAGSIRQIDSFASWLYGVASRVAARARLDAARRRLHESRRAEEAMAVDRFDRGDREGAEAWPELYQELGRLPERFLRPILLCHLEGLSYQQAAERLGCPIRTVQSRLARGRERLRDRLVRRGVAPSFAAVIAALTPDPAAAAVSESWKNATVAAAVQYSAGGLIAELIPKAVAALAEGASQVMSFHRFLKRATAFLFVSAGAGVVGLEIMAYRASASLDEQPAKATAAESPYRATFQSGATIEVIGVSTVPSGPHTWWRPDGTPLAEAPVDTIERGSSEKISGTARVILLRTSGLNKDDNFRWSPVRSSSYRGDRPSRNGQRSQDLEYYEATFDAGRTDCDVKARFASGAWTTETSNGGGGGTGTFVNGHKFAFGKARAFTANGRPMTVFAVAHNFFGQDRRMVAVDRIGKPHPAVSYSAGSDGDQRWVIDLIDAEFDVPLEQIKEFQVQFRPFKEVLIKKIALDPRTAGKSNAAEDRPHSEDPPLITSSVTNGDADSDHDGLSDFQELHKYRTDPRRQSTARDGVSDGDLKRRREFTYSIRSVVKVMPPVTLDCLNDDYQDARVLSRGDHFVELEVIHYPLNTNATAIGTNPDWRRDAQSKQEFTRAGITTNWDDAMRRDLIAALIADGIDPEALDDKSLVSRAAAWLFANSKYVNMFCTHYMHYPGGRAEILPGLEARFEQEKGNSTWSVQEQLDHELFGRAMFANRTHGSCTSSAVFLTTCLRALGIPTRMVLAIPIVDGNDQAQLAMVREGIHHHAARSALLQGLSSAKGYANHTFNEVFVGGRWVRLNYKTLGQNILDGSLMGLLTHVNTFNDLSDVPLAETWGKRYANGERDAIFRYGNPYRCEEVSDHFGKYATIDNPEAHEHRALTITKAYWADDPDAHATIKESKWLFHTDGSRSILVHGEEWFADLSGPQYRPFLEAAGKDFLFHADNHPDIRGRITTSSITWHSRDLHEIEILIPAAEYARMQPGALYTLTPAKDVAGYQWKTTGRVTITKKP